MVIKQIKDTHEIKSCIKIAKTLSDWFDDNDINDIRETLNHLPTFIYFDKEILGFICIDLNLPKVTEIKYIAVSQNYRNSGIGKNLLKYIENKYPENILVVKTLDDSRIYKPYEETRDFYIRNNFIKVDVIKNYPDWDPNSPCAIYIKQSANYIK